MKDMELDEKLTSFDYSQCHPIKEKLLAQLLTMHRRDNMKTPWKSRLSDDELDLAAAAGNPHQQEKQGQKDFTPPRNN